MQQSTCSRTPLVPLVLKYCGVGTSEAKTKFRLGRLYTVRVDIVHHGRHPLIDVTTLDYLAAVYWDLLLHSLGMGSYHAAAQILDSGDIDDWFPRLS
jgi:hypothetical protein